MTTDCTLLSGMPCTRASAERMFKSVSVGSFAEEWIRSQTRPMSITEMVEDYLIRIPAVWDEIRPVLQGLNVTMVKDATVANLRDALATQKIVALLAHHNDSVASRIQGIELYDTVVDVGSIGEMAPTRPIIVHLGVCRSKALIETMKSRCGQVRVIASHAQVEPEFFLRIFVHTVQLWRRDGGDYAQAFIKLRMAMLDALGTPP